MKRSWNLWDCGDNDYLRLPVDHTPDTLLGIRLCSTTWHSAFSCTRLPNHTGRHAAGDGMRIVAVWE